MTLSVSKTKARGAFAFAARVRPVTTRYRVYAPRFKVTTKTPNGAKKTKSSASTATPIRTVTTRHPSPSPSLSPTPSTSPIPSTSPTPTEPVDTTPPPVPSGLVAVPADGSISLSWTDIPATEAPDLVGYHVYRGVAQDGPWTRLTNEPISVADYTASELVNGTTYWFAITSVDETGNASSRSEAVSATPEGDAAGTTHCGTIADNETWGSDEVHVLGCSVTVAVGVTLTIDPGTLIKAYPNGNGTALTVEGTLNANGTTAQPVIFTSIKDGTTGGDYNGDGTTTTPAPGDWAGIYISGPDPGRRDLEGPHRRAGKEQDHLAVRHRGR